MTGTTVIIFCIGVVTFEAVYISFVLFVEFIPHNTMRLSIIPQQPKREVGAVL